MPAKHTVSDAELRAAYLAKVTAWANMDGPMQSKQYHAAKATVIQGLRERKGVYCFPRNNGALYLNRDGDGFVADVWHARPTDKRSVELWGPMIEELAEINRERFATKKRAS